MTHSWLRILAHHDFAVQACGLLAGGAVLLLFRNGKAGGPKSEKLSLPKKTQPVQEALEKSLKSKNGRTFLGVKEVPRFPFGLTGKPFFISREHRERHMQILGPTRSGKSQLLLAITAQDMTGGLPCFFMEAKGDISDFSQFAGLAALSGRLRDLRYFNPADPQSMSFNPILPVSGQDSTSVSNQISRAIGREPGGESDSEYFKSLDYARIQTMAEIFLSTGKAFTLRDAFYYFEFDDCRTKAYEMCKNQHLVDLAKRQFSQPGQQPGRRTDTSALTAKLRPWITGPLGELLNSYSPQIRLEEVFEKKQLAYFAIPIGHLQVLANPLGRMVAAGLLAVASSRQRARHKPDPASIILDEFPEFATPSFATFIATVGSARFWTIFSHQDLGQLKKVQGMDPDAFFSVLFSNSSGCKVTFQAPHPDDAELLAKAVGTTNTIKDTERVTAGILGEVGTGQKSRVEVEEFIAHPNILKGLRPGLALAMPHGEKPGVIATAAVHSLLRGQDLAEIPEVSGPCQEGLHLRDAIDEDEEEFPESDGRSGGPAGKS